MTSVREALKGDDLDAIRQTSSELAESLQRVGTAAYQAQAAGGDGAAPEEEAGEAKPDGEAEAEAEEAVEGEYKEV